MRKRHGDERREGWSVKEAPGTAVRRAGHTEGARLAKLSHCDSKSSFNKVHAVYNFIIFPPMIITLFNHVGGFSES